ncbi:MAG TPA: PAS domain S-box protein, partial [Elusimicrobiales bacterium]|nr:PAS domain S-box protein [Elusimicrobiales bacterium]
MNGPIRILVVDDNPDLRQGTARLLEKAGYAVSTASSGEEALQEAAQGQAPDLMLMDRYMRGIDGLEVCRRLKRIPALAGVGVVIISASSTESDAQAEGLEAGADGYITRPIPNRELLARVESYARIIRLGRLLRRNTEELKRSSEAARQAHLASLNLMEDAVAARERAERAGLALRESEVNFRTFFETMNDMIFVASPDGRVLFTNAAVARTLGYGAGELAGLHLLDLHLADKRSEAEEIFGAIFRGERKDCPLPLARKDGSQVPVETRVWFGRWNGADCLFGISKNLTAEREAQLRFESLFRNSPALMALSSMEADDPRFLDVNEAFLQALGYSKAEVIGKSSSELGLFPDARQQAVTAEMLRVTGRVAGLERQVRRKDGRILDGLFSGEVITSRGRRSFLTVMVDITARKQAEAD